MKKNIFIFLLGLSFGVTILGGFLYWKIDPYISYSYEDKELVSMIRYELERRGILYEYKEDHLKRIWIKPFVDDSQFLPKLIEESNFKKHKTTEKQT